MLGIVGIIGLLTISGLIIIYNEKTKNNKDNTCCGGKKKFKN